MPGRAGAGAGVGRLWLVSTAVRSAIFQMMTTVTTATTGTADAAAGATGPEDAADAGEIAPAAALGGARKRPAAAIARACGELLRAPAECEEASDAAGQTHSAAQHAVAFLHSPMGRDGGELAVAHAPAASKRQRTGLASSDSVPGGADAAVGETGAAMAFLSQPRNPK
jgi:hypothetical protein